MKTTENSPMIAEFCKWLDTKGYIPLPEKCPNPPGLKFDAKGLIKADTSSWPKNYIEAMGR